MFLKSELCGRPQVFISAIRTPAHMHEARTLPPKSAGAVMAAGPPLPHVLLADPDDRRGGDGDGLDMPASSPVAVARNSGANTLASHDAFTPCTAVANRGCGRRLAACSYVSPSMSHTHLAQIRASRAHEHPRSAIALPERVLLNETAQANTSTNSIWRCHKTPPRGACSLRAGCPRKRGVRCSRCLPRCACSG